MRCNLLRPAKNPTETNEEPKNPDGAYQAMKNAVDALVSLPSPPSGLKLHILKKPGSASGQVEQALRTYINNPTGTIRGRVQLIIDEFELIP
jgi:hypothetical protein